MQHDIAKGFIILLEKGSHLSQYENGPQEQIMYKAILYTSVFSTPELK